MSHCTCDYHQEQNKNECFTDIKFEKDGSSSIELNYHIIDENDKCIRCGIFVHGMIEMVTNICPKSLKYSPPKKRQIGEEKIEKLFEEFTKESYWGLEGSSESEKRALEIKAEIFDLIRKKMV